MRWTLGFGLLFSTLGFGKEFLLSPDIRTKASSGAGLYYSSGPSSLAHNPANLSRRSGHELDAELTLGSVDYQYTPSLEKEGGGIELLAPPAFLGAAWQSPWGFKIGLAFIPKGTGQTNTIEKLPMSVQGSDITVRAKLTDKSFRYGLGAAMTLHPDLRLGFSILTDVDQEKTEVFGDAKEPTVTLTQAGTFSRYSLGGTYDINSFWSVAAGYTSPLVKRYQGEIRLFQDLGQTASSAAQFLPSETKLGFQLHLKNLTLDLEYAYLRYAYGRNLRRTGLASSDGEERDLVNTHNMHLAGSVRSGRQTFIAGFALRPSSVGYGKFAPQAGLAGDPLAVQITGIQVSADFDYLNQYIFSGGLLHQWTPKTQLGFYVSHLHGRKDVPSFAPNPGRYRLNVFQLGFGTEYKL